jgi:hypothetical protein
MKWYLDAEYVRSHLRDYIVFQLKQGFELSDIKQALIRYGYEKDLVTFICKDIDLTPYRSTKPASSELDKDLYIYLEELLVDYIEKQLGQGYDLDVVKKALINYGHRPDMVDKAVKAIKHGDAIDLESFESWKAPAALLYFISLVCTLALIFVLSFITGTDIGKVVLAFSPALIAITCTYAIVASMDSKSFNQFIPIAAVALAVGAFIGMLYLLPQMRSLSNPTVLIVLNALAVFILSSLMAFFSITHHKVTKEEILVEQPQPLIKEAVAPSETKPVASSKHRKKKVQKLKIREF